MSLPTRKIGKDDVTAIGLGLMGLAGYYGAIDDEEKLKVLDAAFEEGCTFWDTADVYGDNEDVIGKWLKKTGKRDQIFIATKFGFTESGINGTPEYVRSAAEKSLKRLGVETIDLYYLHRADKNTPIEKTVSAMAELVKEGKVRYLGLSEISSATLRRAHEVHPIAAVQVEYSPFCLDIESEKIGLLKTCRELGIAIVASSPLGRGMLTGAYKSRDDMPADWRKDIPQFSEQNFPNVLKLVKGFQDLGEKHQATAGQVTLSWLLAQGEDIIPIPGTKKIKYLKENLATLKIKLTPSEVAEAREIARRADVQGDRYPPPFMDNLYLDTPPL